MRERLDYYLVKTAASSRPRFPWWVIPGLAVLAAGLWALLRDVPFWNVVWYVPAWYGYLLVLDGAIYSVRGRSFASHRRRELGAMMFWSLPFWFLFEAYNLRIENWYYVFVTRSLPVQIAFTVLAFATVLPACFIHAEALKALGVCRDLRWRPLSIGSGMRTLWLVLGAASVAAPLIWPRYAFPLVWGATLWIPDFLNHKAGAPSFLGDLEEGRGARLVRLLLGGLWAGLIWELFNYWARCKWVYTVPGFEEWKVFEMPVLGFLGFPVLAVAAFSFYSSVCRFVRGGRTWETEDEAQPPLSPRWSWALAAFAATAFSAAVHAAVLSQSHHPYRPLLEDLEGIDETAVGRLRSAGLETPEQLYARAARDGTERLAERLELEAEALATAHRHAALSIHKGMGTEMARLLLAAGVEDVGALASKDPAVLTERLAELASRSGLPAPRPAVVKVWVRAARWNGEPRR